MRDIGKNIKALRECKNLTQEQLAETLFVTRQTVSNYETGRSRPDIEMLTKIADVLDVDANTVIYGAEPAPEQRYEKRSLLIAFVLTFVLGLIWVFLAPAAQEYKTYSYNIIPQVLLHIFLLPNFLLMLGWTLMQSFHVFLGARPLRGERNRLFRRILLTVLALWLILVLLPVADMLRLEIIRFQWLQTHNSFSSVDFDLPGTWHSIVWNPVSTGLVWYVLKYCAMFPVIGISLWLTGFPNRKPLDQ